MAPEHAEPPQMRAGARYGACGDCMQANETTFELTDLSDLSGFEALKISTGGVCSTIAADRKALPPYPPGTSRSHSGTSGVQIRSTLGPLMDACAF